MTKSEVYELYEENSKKWEMVTQLNLLTKG